MVTQITPAQLADWFSQDAATPPAQATLLDVREPWERQTASVRPDGFALVAIPMRELPARLAELDAAQRIACLCHHGMRSQQVAMFLQQNGFQQVANVSGGIDAWSTQLDPAVARY